MKEKENEIRNEVKRFELLVNFYGVEAAWHFTQSLWYRRSSTHESS